MLNFMKFNAVQKFQQGNFFTLALLGICFAEGTRAVFFFDIFEEELTEDAKDSVFSVLRFSLSDFLAENDLSFYNCLLNSN